MQKITDLEARKVYLEINIPPESTVLSCETVDSNPDLITLIYESLQISVEVNNIDSIEFWKKMLPIVEAINASNLLRKYDGTKSSTREKVNCTNNRIQIICTFSSDEEVRYFDYLMNFFMQK